MNVSGMDWAIVAVYFIASLGIGLYYSRRAGKDTSEFFGAGRSLPWWLAGTSMVATTFSSDTPLAVTELVYNNGVAGNWFWWSMVMSGILTVFFFARLWRRVNVLTDIEFAELRYSGKPAAFLRGFRALYLGILINGVIMGWVISAMGTIITVTTGYDMWLAISVCLVITAGYSVVSGLWGVVITDFFQFIIAMTGCVLLAFFGVSAVGGIGNLKEGLMQRACMIESASGAACPAHAVDSFLSVVPPVGSAWLPLFLFFAYIAVNWWASWYPGAEPGGGGYVAQRMFSAKDEKHSLLATLWFNVAHYGIRPWPWVLTALCAVMLFPALEKIKTPEGQEKFAIASPRSGDFPIREDASERFFYNETPDGYQVMRESKVQPGKIEKVHLLTEPRQSFVVLMVTMLPTGVLGLMIAAMAAAFMSTIATHLNWGSSYVVKDFYQRFIKKDADEKHYILVSRLTSILMMFIGGLVGFLMTSQVGGWELLITIGAGTGLTLILRWFWWRVNAWSEISAMVSALVVSMFLKFGAPHLSITFPPATEFAWQLVITTAITTVVWVAVTLLTPPESNGTLDNFFRRARPAGPGWKPVRDRLASEVTVTDDLFMSFMDWIAGCVLIYSFLFGVGKLILGDTVTGAILIAVGIAAAGFIYFDLSRRGWDTVVK